jgi:hypothetical protein
MRVLLGFLLIIFFTATSSAQVQRRATVAVVGLPNGELPNSVRDTLIQRKKDLEKNRLPYNGMPNAIAIRPLPLVYLGNNGKGLDMYSSPVDNMGIVMPDSTFSSNMPFEKPGNASVMIVPGNRLNELLEAQKKRDSLFMPPKPQYIPKQKKQFRPLF